MNLPPSLASTALFEHVTTQLSQTWEEMCARVDSPVYEIDDDGFGEGNGYYPFKTPSLQLTTLPLLQWHMPHQH